MPAPSATQAIAQGAASHLAPLAGRGRPSKARSGEGDSPRGEFVEAPPHPTFSPQAGRRRQRPVLALPSARSPSALNGCYRPSMVLDRVARNAESSTAAIDAFWAGPRQREYCRPSIRRSTRASHQALNARRATIQGHNTSSMGRSCCCLPPKPASSSRQQQRRSQSVTST
jgi:hypothetical protein